MDDNNFNNYDEFDNLQNGSDNLSGEPEDLGKTQEMESVLFNREADEEARSITPRDEFIEMNSADDMSRTLLMDSVSDGEERYEPADNPVKKRRRKHKKKQINHTRTMGQIFLGAVISVAAICIGTVLAFKVIDVMRDITGMAKQQKEMDFTIYDNTTLDDIADSLYNNNIILSPKLFKFYVNYNRKKHPDEFDFLLGTYTLRSNMSYGSIVDMFRTEKEYTKTVLVMIPEGATAADIGRLLQENYVCRAADFERYYKSKLRNYDFEEGIGSDPYRLNALEGYLFPDTYEFYVIDDLKANPAFDTEEYAKIAADTMYKNFENKITKDLVERMEEMDMTLDETIILASLIQWEGTNEDNMSKVSSVFHNRMKDPEKFPKLESNTTYTYIDQCITPRINASNMEEMKAIADAYDTYQCEGLPPGAICNPGLEAIKAALYPANTDYKYFLTSADGVFYYAQTLEQHEKNIQDAALRENND